SFITGALQVSDQEVQDQYNHENTSFTLVYSLITPDQLKDKITASDADLHSYFDAHKADFRIDKQQRQIDYLFISQDAVGNTIKISDEELKKDYDPEKFLDGVRVSQIMLKVLTPKDDAVVKSKADELVARARGTAGTKAEDFDALARGNSQDTATKDK